MAVNLFPTTNSESLFTSTGRSNMDFTINPMKNFDNTQILNSREISNSNISIIPIWIRDTYAKIQPTPIYNLQGPLRENINSEIEAREALSQGIEKSNLFLSGADVFGYLNRNINRELCDQTVTIVIHSLRDLYWNNKQTLPREIVSNLEIALRDPLPTFKNVFEYISIQNLSESLDLPLYQMFGTITPFSVLHIPVTYFIEALNAKVPIQVALENTNIIIQLDYEQYDFWDTISESMVDYIDIQSRCK